MGHVTISQAGPSLEAFGGNLGEATLDSSIVFQWRPVLVEEVLRSAHSFRSRYLTSTSILRIFNRLKNARPANLLIFVANPFWQEGTIFLLSLIHI